MSAKKASFLCKKNRVRVRFHKGVSQILVNQKELAKILGITPRWVQKLTKENDMFSHKEGRSYILAECVQEFIEYKIEAETSGSNDPDYWKEKANHEGIKRQISEQKLSKMKRESFDAEDVEEAWAYILLNFKNKLTSLPHKLATLLVNESSTFKITENLKNEFNSLLHELSDFNINDIETKEEFFDDEDEDEYIQLDEQSPKTIKTSKKAKSKRVGGKKPNTKQPK